MELELQIDHDPSIVLMLIYELPIGTPIKFKLPPIRSITEGTKLRQLVKFLVRRVKPGTVIELDHSLQPPIARTIAKYLSISAELRLIPPMPPATAIPIVAKLKFGRILQLAAASPKAAQAIVSALQPGRILRIHDGIDQTIAESAVKALAEGCTLRLFENITIPLGKKLVTAMKSDQVLSLPAKISTSTMLEMAKLLPRSCELQLSANLDLEIAALVVQQLKSGCILKIDSIMNTQLMLTMIDHLPSGCAVTFPIYQREDLEIATEAIQHLHHGHTLRIPPATAKDVACVLIGYLPPGCALELSDLMPDETAMAIISNLPKRCLFKLPTGFPPDRMEAWIKSLPDQCLLDLPIDIGKSLALAMQAAKYKVTRALTETVMYDFKNCKNIFKSEVKSSVEQDQQLSASAFWETKLSAKISDEPSAEIAKEIDKVSSDILTKPKET